MLTGCFYCISFTGKFFLSVLFNKLKREALPILLKSYLDNPRNEQRYSSSQIIHDKFTEIFFRLFADLVFDYICYIYIVNADVFHDIFSNYKKIRDYYSTNLHILAEPKSPYVLLCKGGTF